VSSPRKITWSPRALKQFSAAIQYIRQESFQNAESVKERILSKIGRLSDANVTHRKDPYKNNNDGHFHYFELLSYRISYYENENEIIIVRLRHVSKKPLNY
jgi:plasmid stabilization system protein ParE